MVVYCSTYDGLLAMAPTLGSHAEDSQSRTVLTAEDDSRKSVAKTTSATSGEKIHHFDIPVASCIW